MSNSFVLIYVSMEISPRKFDFFEIKLNELKKEEEKR